MSWDIEDIPGAAATVVAAAMVLLVILRSGLGRKTRAILTALVLGLVIWAHLEAGSS